MLRTSSDFMATQPIDPLSTDEQPLLTLLARIVLTLPRDLSAGLGKAAGVSLSEHHVLAHLTAAGWERLEVAAPAHRESARRHLLGRLTPAHTRAMADGRALMVEPVGRQESASE